MFGLDGTPPGVLTFTASLRVPSPRRVKAATWKIHSVKTQLKALKANRLLPVRCIWYPVPSLSQHTL